MSSLCHLSMWLVALVVVVVAALLVAAAFKCLLFCLESC